MSGMFDRQKAVLEFRRFVAEHLSSQGRHGDFVAPDPPLIASTEVKRSEVLNVFFQLHPEHLKYRPDVSADAADDNLLSFSKERWEETTTKLTNAVE